MDSIECSAEPNSNETKGDAFYWNFTFDLTFKFRRSMLKVHNLLVLLTVPLIHFLKKGPFGGTGAGLFGLVVRPELWGGTGPGGGGAGL